MKKTFWYRTLAVLLALLVWHLVSVAVANDIYLVSPLRVLVRLTTIWREKGFFSTVLYTMARILLGFVLALTAGFLSAVLAGRFHFLEYLLWPYVITFRSVPVASFIILSLIWLTFSQLTVFIAVLIVFPVIYSNVLQGMKSTDPKLLEMASLYRVPWYRRFLYVELPSIRPYLLSACTISIGMAWKSGIAAEIIGIVSGSIGGALYSSKIYLETCDLFAWTVIIVILSVLTEKAFLRLLKRAFAGYGRR